MRDSTTMTRCIWLVAFAAACNFAIWLFSPNRTNTLRADRILGVKPPSSGKPVILLRHRRVVAGSKLEFAFVNPTRASVRYIGYVPRGPRGDIHPAYGVEFKEADNAAWASRELGKCGFGPEELSIPPGHAGRFYVQLYEQKPTSRVGIHCEWKDKDGQVREEMIWREEIPQQMEP